MGVRGRDLMDSAVHVSPRKLKYECFQTLYILFRPDLFFDAINATYTAPHISAKLQYLLLNLKDIKHWNCETLVFFAVCPTYVIIYTGFPQRPRRKESVLMDLTWGWKGHIIVLRQGVIHLVVAARCDYGREHTSITKTKIIWQLRRSGKSGGRVPYNTAHLWTSLCA